MKKTGILMCMITFLLLYDRYEVVDLKRFSSDTKTIEVKGAVASPGVYEVEVHANMQEVIEIAGGILENGDVSTLNLSRDVGNHEVIVVAEKKEMLISINSASAEELQQLSGIGPTIAQRIIVYRCSQSFQTLEDIKNVKGIGDKLFEKIKDSICL